MTTRFARQRRHPQSIGLWSVRMLEGEARQSGLMDRIMEMFNAADKLYLTARLSVNKCEQPEATT